MCKIKINNIGKLLFIRTTTRGDATVCIYRVLGNGGIKRKRKVRLELHYISLCCIKTQYANNNMSNVSRLCEIINTEYVKLSFSPYKGTKQIKAEKIFCKIHGKTRLMANVVLCLLVKILIFDINTL